MIGREILLANIFLVYNLLCVHGKDLTCLCGTLISDDKRSSSNSAHEIYIEGCQRFDLASTIQNSTNDLTSSIQSKNDLVEQCLSDRTDPVCRLGFCQTDGYCYKTVAKKKDHNRISYSCLRADMLEPKSRPLICHPSQARLEDYNVGCCWSSDFCNKNLNITLKVDNTTDTGDIFDPTSLGNILLYSLLPICFILLMATVGMLFFHLCRKRNNKRNYKKGQQQPGLPLSTGMVSFTGNGHGVGVTSFSACKTEKSPLINDSQPSSTIKEMLEESYSGSGSGLPVLMQRTVSQQISKKKVIGQGSFGEVWLGHWRGENVAVKIFSSRDEKSWVRECEIYQTVMLRHENILGFIAADSKDDGAWTQLWLVTDYHENGSLFDFLSKCVVTPSQMINMALSISTGLAHLHMPIVGSQGKPAIAHRDIKSKNILVKRDLTCTIADLGLCVRHIAETDQVDIPDNNKVGTKRYLAPEILDDSLDPHQFEAWKRADIYSLSLVMWELVRRCSLGGTFEDFELPFYEMVSPDPSIEEMREVVCTKKVRPSCPDRWQQSQQLKSMTKLMKDCWYENPFARLTALRVKKTIATIVD